MFLSDLGINAVFISSGDIDQKTIERIGAEGGQTFAEFPILNGDYDGYVANHPEAHPIDETGNPVARATWFMGVCPTDSAVIKWVRCDLFWRDTMLMGYGWTICIGMLSLKIPIHNFIKRVFESCIGASKLQQMSRLVAKLFRVYFYASGV